MPSESYSDPLQRSTPGTPKPGPNNPNDPKQIAKEQAGALWQDTKETARSKLGEHKQTAVSGIVDLAGALHAAAKDLEGKQQATVARFAHGAADSLEQLSGALERRDLDGIMREAESFARRQPVAFVGAAIAAGFLAMRFMKSSQSDH